MFDEVLWITLVVVAALKLFELSKEACNGSRMKEVDRSNSAVFAAEYDRSHRQLQFRYLTVYFLAVAADWLQGPYVYALYSFYGFENRAIGVLYIVGFASSALFGTFIAALADRYGRRRLVLVFAGSYGLSCLTKHVGRFEVLLLGRILGGIAYSILFSVFEAWLVCEHNSRKLSPHQLSLTFARAQFGNGVIAIVAGQFSEAVAARWNKVAPFDAALVVLILTFAVASRLWTENYGDAAGHEESSIREAWKLICTDEKVLILGIVSTCFEGALYAFTFAWTPALQARVLRGEIPHGTVFSTMMACMMGGGSLFAILVDFGISVEILILVVFASCFGAFVVSIMYGSFWCLYSSFLVFEIGCGVYFPALSSLRAPLIPERVRGSMLSLFRLPLNLLVVAILSSSLNSDLILLCCAWLMGIGLLGQWRFVIRGRARVPIAD